MIMTFGVKLPGTLTAALAPSPATLVDSALGHGQVADVRRDGLGAQASGVARELTDRQRSTRHWQPLLPLPGYESVAGPRAAVTSVARPGAAVATPAMADANGLRAWRPPS